MKDKAQRIDPERWYNLSEMVDEKVFSWCKNIATYRRHILSDRKNSNLLKAVVIGTGRQKQYRIKGENIIKFVVSVEDGTHHI